MANGRLPRNKKPHCHAVTVITLKKQGNIGTTEIRMAEDKVRGIEEIAAQLLRENPDLIQPQYAANEDVAP